jgi:arginine-tRNA-protein transferase
MSETATVHGTVVDCGACPYLPGREFHAFQPRDARQVACHYRWLMDHRFRRSGCTFYMPACPGCAACQPVRVDVAAFRPRDDQRRCRKRNADLTVSWQARGLDDERRALFVAYQREVHEQSADEDAGRFLVEDAGVPGGEIHARDGAGRLLAVSICDRFDDALSSVYCYWRPDQAWRGLGTFMALAELDYSRREGLDWLYLGFLVEGCSKMEYKARFRPQEVLVDERWCRRGG